MLKTPCEAMHWQGLPIIRKELIRCMINNYGLNQKMAADKLGVTPAAVSQYLADKRGKINISNSEILIEINYSAEKIINKGSSAVSIEMCRICKILRKNGILSFTAF